MNETEVALKLALLCGGPSLERGISLNSARSFVHHIQDKYIDLSIYYIDEKFYFYQLSIGFLYSNTPDDFSFKLNEYQISLVQFITQLQSSDIVFPLIHGVFGEDGSIQCFLERHNIAFVGSRSHSCQKFFHKKKSQDFLKKHNFPSLAACLINKENFTESLVRDFFQRHELKQAIVKPCLGGSSLEVNIASSSLKACQLIESFFLRYPDEEILLEEFCYGQEFTLIVLTNELGKPVALMPTQIYLKDPHHTILDYRKKYLITDETLFICPPDFSLDTIEAIQSKAEKIFQLFEMNDFVRMDGWLLEDGKIIFHDINTISGMEQNSFFFQQGTRLGLTHQLMLFYLIKNALKRYSHVKSSLIELRYGKLLEKENQKIALKNKFISYLQSAKKKENVDFKMFFNNNACIASAQKPVFIVFGGDSSERQVSLLSGINVCLNLLKNKQYQVYCFYLDLKMNLWCLPYFAMIVHNLEEIEYLCHQNPQEDNFMSLLKKKLQEKLNIDIISEVAISQFSFDSFLKIAQAINAYVFLSLHGGQGENGFWQKKLREHNLRHNGSLEKESHLCMDKYIFSQEINKIDDLFISSNRKQLLPQAIWDNFSLLDSFWAEAQITLGQGSILIKPRFGGCSHGVIKLNTEQDLYIYLNAIKQKKAYIEKDDLSWSNSRIYLSSLLASSHLSLGENFMIEKYVHTDKIRIINHELSCDLQYYCVELTIAIIERKGEYHVFSPSLTVINDNVLSEEEKFQGGTGINLTPPPEFLISTEDREHIKNKINIVCQNLSLKNYARIDFFFNVNTKGLNLIEVNTLPALTPSTVLFQQAYHFNPKMTTENFLSHIIQNSI